MSDVTSWESKAGKTFGHTFKEHGQKMYNNLVGRLETGNPQGNWLNDANAAKYLESIKDQIEALKPGEAHDFALPSGLGQVVKKNAVGEVITEPASKVRVVRGSQQARAFIRSAFPIN